MTDLERILNNTYNEKYVNDSITTLRLSNYNFLHDIQESMLSHNIYDLSTRNITKDNRIKYDVLKNQYIMQIPFEFITHSCINSFIRSKYNRVPFDIFEISNNPIFYFNCLCFIDGILYTGYKIYPVHDILYIIFDKDYYLKKLKNTNKNITFIILPNLNIVSSTSNSYLLEKGIPSSDMKEVDYKNAGKFNYIHTVSNDMCDNIILLTKTQGNNIYYTTPIPEEYYGIDFNMNRLGFQYLNGTKLVRKNTDYFELPEKAMPISSSGMIVFERTSTGLIYAHGVRVEHYYPNIFKLVNHDSRKNYYVLHFYVNGSNLGDMSYENKFKLLDRIGFSLLDGYMYDFLEPVVANYFPEYISYSIEDLNNSKFNKPIDYKDSKLKELISIDSKNSSSYFDMQVDYPKRLYLDISRIDLDSRIRLNTSKETPHDNITFNKPQYVFSIKKSILANPLSSKVYIDGAIQTYKTTTENEFNVYLYIPCEYITPFSMMEFESFENTTCRKIVNVVGNKGFLEADTECKFCKDDIVITDIEYNILPSDSYKIYINSPIGYVLLSNDYNTEIKSDIKIVFLGDISYNKVIFNITHPSFSITQEILTEDDIGKAIYINKPIDRDIEHFRIYKNGRLVPSEYYSIKYRNNINSELGVDIKLAKSIGDVIVVDISPIKYNEVLNIKKIPITGLIKTNGVLNKPFSLKWYDVFLNGKKLNASNIDIISPTKFFVYNVDSTSNLVILESNRDFEYFSINETYMSYNDKLWDEYPGLSTQLILQNGFIINTEEDIISPSVSEKSIDLDRFYEYYGKHQFMLNPDVSDVPDEIWNQFDDLKTDNVIILDPDVNPTSPSMLEFINEEF